MIFLSYIDPGIHIDSLLILLSASPDRMPFKGGICSITSPYVIIENLCPPKELYKKSHPTAKEEFMKIPSVDCSDKTYKEIYDIVVAFLSS